MCARAYWRSAIRSPIPFMLLLATLNPPAFGEITSLTGSVETTVREYVDGVEQDSSIVRDSFPETSDLPLVATTTLVNNEGDEEAAGGIAAQFADPRTSEIANPEEFALNLAFNSIAHNVAYEGSAVVEEVRTVLFAPGEISAFSAEGNTETLTGRVFLDGALVVLGATGVSDLGEAEVSLRVVIEQVSASDEQHATVFDGALVLRAAGGTTVEPTATGDLPQSEITLADLAVFVDELDVFQVLVIPNIALDYTYTAVVGEEFDLVATVTLEGRNAPAGVGVTGVIGTPFATIQEVLGGTTSNLTASVVRDAIDVERTAPTGDYAFPESRVTPVLFPACGLFGFEWLLGLVGFGAWRLGGTRGRN